MFCRSEYIFFISSYYTRRDISAQTNPKSVLGEKNLPYRQYRKFAIDRPGGIQFFATHNF